MDDKRLREESRSSIHNVSPIIAVLVFGFILALFGVVYAIDNNLPTLLKVQDEENNPDAFIGERAKNDLKVLTSNGPRVAGTYENEVLAVHFLEGQIDFIKQQAHANQKVEIDTQVVSGQYFLDFKPYGAFNAYGNAQNVIAKLNGKGNATILINAHFDSVPTSPGGSDDGIMCATMLEILRKLSKRSERLEHSVVFLFNGAEETPLQGSHGFITQHVWAKDVQIMINLEAAGHGSKEILFQTGPDHPWLINYYKNVPHPYGQATGEEIFQLNIIPSDTDFRIFRDFGKIFGYDFAFARNGYRYHTKYDDFENIPDGSYQHVGDNILALVKNLGEAPELKDDAEPSTEKIVYFDFLGLFMITYNMTAAYIINLIIAAVSIASTVRAFFTFNLKISFQTAVCLGCIFASILGGWLLSTLSVVLIALFLDGIHYSMSWYGNPYLVFGLFCMPSVLVSSVIFAVLKTYKSVFSNISISAFCQIQLHVTRLLWTLLLVVVTLFGIRSAYLLLIPILFNTAAFLIIQIFKLEYSVHLWKIIYLISMIIPTMVMYYFAIASLTLFIPIMGRISCDKNSDLLIGLNSAGLTILISTYYIPLLTLVRKSRYLLLLMLGIFVIFLIFVFTPLGFPYSGDKKAPAPQRHWIHHTTRSIYDENNELVEKDSGYFMLNMDRNSPRAVEPYVPQLKDALNIEKFCYKYVLCGLPIFNIRITEPQSKVIWIPSEEPVIHELINLNLIDKIPSENVIDYSFKLTGPDHATMFFAMKKGCKLLASSFTDFIPTPFLWRERETYFVKYGWNKEATPLYFNLTVETPYDLDDATLDIVVSGQNVHEKQNTYTREFQDFLSRFPDWADLTTGLASVQIKTF